ncbi:molybdenum cofactor biosynthesis protein MoeB [Rhodohalobacter sp. SW132]|uniref:ThiF family adenylyltransferase n=1 Tax=Rhodohalobacter sp. SW132 TaxID=2293433 RepID=UPI000E24B7C9|nr:ThiF family adenylyltransferase [Rhodohalobacter sp. SW132]REL38856.1 molybdenum cofactor biosynthesis protein MoeB [Rhodohalobacter sp. SW132]
MNSPKSNHFTPDELRHYSRQMAMPQFGGEGQKKLKRAKVAVIGAGGLGAPVLQYLSAAGVGTIGIFDFDVIEESNLHRQVLFNTEDIGKSKARVASKRLEKLNPHINIIANQVRITPENVINQFRLYDLIVDGSDNFQTRYIVNDAALLLDLPLVYGSIYRFEGQITVFNYVDEEKKRGPDLRDLYPKPPDTGFIPDCSTAGVLGVLPGVIGSIQATEAIKILADIGDVLSGKLLVMDLLNIDTQMITFAQPAQKRTIDRPAIEERLKSYRNDYDAPRGVSAQTVSDWINSSEKINLVDVRSPEEHERFNIGGTLIPLDEIELRSNEINTETKTVIYCKSGQRSAEAIRRLSDHKETDLLYNLDGGVDSWRDLFNRRER